MRKSIYFSLAFLLLFSYGCPFGSGVGLKMSTDKDVYSAREEVIVYIENEGNSSAYFSHCNYALLFHIEIKADDVWIRPFGDEFSCFFYPIGILELAPGEIDTIEIPNLPIIISGNVYRLAAPYSLEQTEDGLPELLYSNEFTVQ